MYFVYILISTKFKGKTYVGFTSNLNARLIAHNHPQNKGYTKRFQPWSILYSEELNTKQEAMKREKYFKSGAGRKYIQRIIEDTYCS